MRTRITAPVFAALLLYSAGCASGSSATSSALGGSPVSTQIVQGAALGTTGTIAVNMAATNVSSKIDVPLSMNEAWPRLEAAYAALGIKLTDHDPAAHLIGNSSFKARRKLGDVLLAKALECGGETSAPNAESYDLVLSIRSQLSTSPANKVQLETFVEGVGRNPMTNNSIPVKCVTQGLFEKRILDMVRDGVPAAKKP